MIGLLHYISKATVSMRSSIIFLLVVMTAVAYAHIPPRKGERGKGKPGRRGPKFGCFAECKDECTGSQKGLGTRFRECVRPCIAECDKGEFLLNEHYKLNPVKNTRKKYFIF